jgi:hypothetical protein
MHAILGGILTKMTGGMRDKWPEFVESAVFTLNALEYQDEKEDRS